MAAWVPSLGEQHSPKTKDQQNQSWACRCRGVNPKHQVLRLTIRTELPNSGLQLTKAPARLS
jgi:hypothetical protein